MEKIKITNDELEKFSLNNRITYSPLVGHTYSPHKVDIRYIHGGCYLLKCKMQMAD